MSIEATTWAFSVRVKSGPKLVLLALANCHNGRTGRCDPSIITLCDDTGLSKTAVHRALRDLEAAGLITATRNPPKKGQRFHGRSSYTLHIGVHAKHIERPKRTQRQRAECAPCESADRVRNADPVNRVSNAHEQGVECGHEPEVEPEEEYSQEKGRVFSTTRVQAREANPFDDVVVPIRRAGTC